MMILIMTKTMRKARRIRVTSNPNNLITRILSCEKAAGYLRKSVHILGEIRKRKKETYHASSRKRGVSSQET